MNGKPEKYTSIPRTNQTATPVRWNLQKRSCFTRKVQSGLHFAACEYNAEIVIREEQTALRVRGRATRIEEPGLRAG